MTHWLARKRSPPFRRNNRVQQNEQSRIGAFSPVSRGSTTDIAALYKAARKGDAAGVRDLVKKGANPNAIRANGYPICSDASDLATLEAFLECGSDPNAVEPGNVTLLHFAALDDDIEKCQLLIDYGADINAADNEGRTPVFYARDTKAMKALEFLAKHGADINARRADDGWTVLHSAAAFDLVEFVNALMRNGANIEDRNTDGQTPLIIASCMRRDDTDVLEVLLRHGADVQAAGNDGWQAIHRAAFGGSKKAISLLISHGASVNAQTLEGLTPADIAESEGHTDVVEVLTKHGSK